MVVSAFNSLAEWSTADSYGNASGMDHTMMGSPHDA